MVDPDHRAEVDAEINKILAGNIERTGEYWVAPSGRRYGQHNDSLHPVDGPGVVSLSRMQHQVAKELNNKGLDGAGRMMDALRERGILSSEQIEEVLELCRKCPR